jgi:hypothetical protein
MLKRGKFPNFGTLFEIMISNLQRMKNVIILFLAFCAITHLQAQENKAPQKLKFATTTYDFGSKPQGKPVNTEFEFSNMGTEPLVLETVKASCGCTTPEWTKEPVMPGKKGTIKVQYNMAREGSFNKTITVTTKDSETVVLTITGNAVAQKEGVDESTPSMISAPNGQ